MGLQKSSISSASGILASRARLEQHDMKLLAAADALTTLSGHRRQLVWDAAGLHAPPELLQYAPVNEDCLELQAAPEGEEIVWDYASTGLTLRRHPLALLRPKMAAKKLMPRGSRSGCPTIAWCAPQAS